MLRWHSSTFKCFQSWANSQDDNHFHSKRPPRTILSENSCHFFNLLSFVSSSFFLSMIKITWLNSQQPKTKGHVELDSEFRIWELEKTPNFSPEISIEFCLWKLFLLELILSFSECTKLLLRNLCIDSVRGEYKFGWDIPVWESWVGMVNWFPKSGWGTVNWLTWGP